MERLTPEDEVMLWPDMVWPQAIGMVAILDGAPLLEPDGRVRVEAVRDRIAARLHRVPRLRQLLVTPGPGLGGPLWIDAIDFDIDQHVHVVPLPLPGDRAMLVRVVERLRRRRLDRDHPLWQLYLLPGLADNRVGVYATMHHAIADGIAGIATIGALLDLTADPPPDPPPPAWRPQPGPTTRQLLVDNVRRQARRVTRAATALTHPAALARQVRDGISAVRELSSGRPEPPISLNQVIGPGRRIALIRDRLATVSRVAHDHHATVNDVLLTIVGGGLRALLVSRGEWVEDRNVRVHVPITLRPVPGRAEARGNLIGQLVIPVPVGIADPARRLEAIAAVTAERKATSHPSVAGLLNNRLGRRLALRLLDRRPINVTSADLVGPAGPVFLAGAEVLEIYPVLPLMANLALGVGALSYAGQFAITVVADEGAHPDLDVFVEHACQDLVRLAEEQSVAIMA